MWLFLLWIVLAVATAAVAHSRGRDVAGWAVLGFLFGPVALPVVFFLPAIQPEAAPPAADEAVITEQMAERLAQRQHRR